MTKSVFGAYDIRGLVGQTINTSFAERLGKAFGHYLGGFPDKTVLVGMDSRVDSFELAKALSKGLISTGVDVAFMGLASTPMVSWLAADYHYDGAVIVTASHLTQAYNGFKLCGKSGQPIGLGSGMEIVEQMFNKNEFPKVAVSGKISHESYSDVYIDVLERYMRIDTNVEVAIDAGHGSIGPELAKLFNTKQVYYGLNLEPNGDFSSRPSNPLEPGALDELVSLVLAKKLDFGAAFDCDADRIIVVDNIGNMVDPDLITAILSKRLLQLSSQSYPNKILYDLRSSKAVPESIEACGGMPIKCKVGHSFIRTIMFHEQALFAGEISGHYYYSDLYYTENALRTLIELINIVHDLKEDGITLNQATNQLKKYHTSSEINIKVASIDRVINKLKSTYSDAHLEYIDGLTVAYPTWWFNVRASQTEPILRLRLEASDVTGMQTRLVELQTLISNH